jgi:tRNA pseudouridine55 synthase
MIPLLLEGVLPVKKPVGFTSHDVVAKVRGITRIRRIGHTGTLDPQVTGVLPLCIGRATRIVEYLQELPKEYEAVLTVGYSTDTEDTTGRVLAQVERAVLTEEAVRETLAAFVGVIQQIPPMYSAVKIEGKRLYELARQGEEVERQPREVEIYQIDIMEMDLTLAHPQIRFRVKCSKGTYIRTLCADIGVKLGYPAVMSHLVRTATGFIDLAQCMDLEEITRLMGEGRLGEVMIKPDQAIAHMPALTVGHVEAERALKGQTLFLAENNETAVPSAGLLRLYAPAPVSPEPGEGAPFLGIFRYDPARQLLKPEKVFN